jgi:hypothetical protein
MKEIMLQLLVTLSYLCGRVPGAIINFENNLPTYENLAEYNLLVRPFILFIYLFVVYFTTL